MAARTIIPLYVFNQQTGLPVGGATVALTYRNGVNAGAPAPIYQYETGSAQVPGGTPPGTATTSDVRGRPAGWLERGAYQALISGAGLLAYSENFDVAPGSDKAISDAWLNDGARHDLGDVKMWWRAADAVTPPPGWEIMDGRAWSTIPNDLGLSTGTIPDMINSVPLGANPANPQGLGGAALDSHGAAPGIGGVQGSNQLHQHTVPGHGHAVHDPGHSHVEWIANAGTGGFTGAHVGGSDINPGAISTQGASTGITVGPDTTGDNDQATTSADVRPQSRGLLFIMKVRAA